MNCTESFRFRSCTHICGTAYFHAMEKIRHMYIKLNLANSPDRRHVCLYMELHLYSIGKQASVHKLHVL